MTDGNEEVYLLGRGYFGNMGDLSHVEGNLFGDLINPEIEILLYRSAYARINTILDINKHRNDKTYGYSFNDKTRTVRITRTVGGISRSPKVRIVSPVSEAMNILRIQVANLVIGSCFDVGCDRYLKDYLPNVPYKSVSTEDDGRATTILSSYDISYKIFDRHMTHTIVVFCSAHKLGINNILRLLNVRHDMIIFVVPDSGPSHNSDMLEIGWKGVRFNCTYDGKGVNFQDGISTQDLIEAIGSERITLEPKRRHMDPLIQTVLNNFSVIVYK